VTSILHCHWLKFFWHNTAIRTILKLKNYNRSKPEILRLLMWDIIFFKLFAYLMKMNCWNLLLLYKIVYIWIFVKFWQRFISISQDNQIDVLYVSFNAWDSQVSSYTPFHFSFTVPLSCIIHQHNFICIQQNKNRKFRKLFLFLPVSTSLCFPPWLM